MKKLCTKIISSIPVDKNENDKFYRFVSNNATKVVQLFTSRGYFRNFYVLPIFAVSHWCSFACTSSELDKIVVLKHSANIEDKKFCLLETCTITLMKRLKLVYTNIFIALFLNDI